MSKIKKALLDHIEWPYTLNQDGDIFTEPNRYNGYVIRKIKGRLTHNGYLRMTLQKDGKSRQVQMHKVIAHTFIPNPSDLPCVNHINGIKTDNRVQNLEWVTYAQNTHHAVENGLLKSNLNIEKVNRIKSLVRTMRGKDIAEMFNVSKATVSLIKNGRTWK